MAAISSEDVSRSSVGGLKRSGGPPANQIPKKIGKKERKGKEPRPPIEEPPTQVIQTDAAHFRMLVQELTSGKSPTPPSPPPSLSPASSPLSSPSAITPKTNQRLRSLAPPPIRPIPSPAAQGFRPVPPRNSSLSGNTANVPQDDTTSSAEGPSSSLQGPSSSLQGPSSSLQGPSSSLHGHSSSLQGPSSSLQGPSNSISPGSNNTSMPQFPMAGMPGSPFALFSPHLLSPLALLSPRDLFWAGFPESPGSLAMKEMAMMAMAQAMGARDANGVPMGRQENFPQPGGMMPCPSPTSMHPMLHSGYGAMFPAFPAGFGLAPQMTMTTASMPISPPGYYGDRLYDPTKGPPDGPS